MLKYLSLVFILISAPLHAQNRVDIGLFSQQDITLWKQKKFSGQTHYSLQLDNKRIILSADSQQSASAFYKKIKVDLEKTPFLNWSWSKQKQINPGKESEKLGDDFVGRLYVIKDGGLFFWKTLSLNYVWSYQHSKNESWDSPFAGSKSKMVSLRDISDSKDLWFIEKRNVYQDFNTLLGKTIKTIDGIAIMTDSDNSGLSSKAYYGDIYFTAD
jgi:hypothetical protein